MTRNTKILILSGCLVFLALSILTVKAVFAQDMYRLNRSGSAEAVKTINTYGAAATEECRIVTNTAAAIDYMVPYKTLVEWNAFKFYKPAAVTLASCCVGCSAAGICQAGGGCPAGSCVAVTNIAAGTDPNSQCTAVYNSCVGTNRIGPDGNCNGSGACNTGGLSSDCGGDYWTDSYACSGTMLQRLYHSRGCSAGSCYDNASWQNYTECGGGYWVENYSCAGAQPVKLYHSQGCSGSSCYDTTSWVNWGNPCVTAGACETGGGCSGGSCTAVGFVADGTDPNGDCTAGGSSCVGTVAIGADGYCNYQGDCRTSGYSYDCDAEGGWWYVPSSRVCSGEQPQDIWCYYSCSGGNCNGTADCYYKNYGNACPVVGPFFEFQCAGNDREVRSVMYGCGGAGECYSVTDTSPWTYYETCPTAGACQAGGGCSGGSCDPVVADTTSCNCLSNQSSCQSAGCYWHSYGFSCTDRPCEQYYDDGSACIGAGCYWDGYSCSE